MTREIAHFQMFAAALETIQPNFPPGVLQGDPRYSNPYFNLTNGASARGPWNQGQSPQFGEEWEYVEDPLQHVIQTQGMTTQEPKGTDRTLDGVARKDEEMSRTRSEQVKKSLPKGSNQWSSYPQEKLQSPTKARKSP